MLCVCACSLGFIVPEKLSGKEKKDKAKARKTGKRGAGGEMEAEDDDEEEGGSKKRRK